jgi:tetratricopeptide (TPR) repeat protein
MKKIIYVLIVFSTIIYGQKSATDYNSDGINKLKLKDYYGAIKDFDKAIELNPNSSDVYLFRGGTKSKIEDFTGALIDFNKAIELNPNDANLYIARATAKFMLKDSTSAIMDFNKAIELNPNDAKVYLARGQLKYILEDKDGACFDWRKAVELGNDTAVDFIKKYCKESSILKETLKCEDLVHFVKDKMKDDSFWITNKTLIISEDKSNRLDIEFLKEGNAITLFITVIGAGTCIDKNNEMIILLRDGTKKTLQNNGGFNCKKQFMVFFDNLDKMDFLKEMNEKEVEAIRVWTTNSYVQVEFTKEQSEIYKNIISCLMNK